MASDVLSDMDRSVLNGSVLDSDEWAYMTQSKMDIFPHFVDMDTSLSPEQLFTTELEMGAFELEVTDDTWKELSDGSDSGIDALSMKPEPLSPSSLFSETSSDLGNSSCATDTSSVFPNSAEMTQDEWDSIQSVLTDDLESIKDELLSDIDLTVTDPFPGTTLDLASIDQQFGFTNEYRHRTVETTVLATPVVVTTTVATPNTVAVPVTVRPTKCVVKPVVTIVNGKIPSNVISQVLLNSKVNIQPKPLHIQSVTTAPPHTADKPMPMGIMPTLPAVTQLTHLTKLVPALTPTPSISTNSLIDVKAVKRQQRMIKNRESACLSRKRKKDYMQSLEDQLHAFNSDNERLRMENGALKRKLVLLQSENERLKRVTGGQVTSKAAGVTLLFCVALIMSVNYLPSLPSLSSTDSSIHRADIPPSSHIGNRMLLSVSRDSEQQVAGNVSADEHRQMSITGDDDSKASIWHDVRDLVFGRHSDGSTLNGRFICPTFFNSTESLRLVNELRGWVLGHEEELRRQQQQQQQLDQEANKHPAKPRKKYYPPRKLKAAMRGAMLDRFGDLNTNTNKYEMQLFKGSSGRYDNFLDAINRRNDTFYVVSFRRDHLLLPATAHNKTMRPRMSLMMPAVGLNETMSPPFGSIAMMQIDCEVTATRLVNIEKSAVPHHLINNSTPNNHHHQSDDLRYEPTDWAPPISAGGT